MGRLYTSQGTSFTVIPGKEEVIVFELKSLPVLAQILYRKPSQFPHR